MSAGVKRQQFAASSLDAEIVGVVVDLRENIAGLEKVIDAMRKDAPEEAVAVTMALVDDLLAMKRKCADASAVIRAIRDGITHETVRGRGK